MSLSISKRLSGRSGRTTSTKSTVGKRIKSAVLALSFMSVQLISPAVAVATGNSPVPANNPGLTQSCGLDIALVMDRSNSIGSTDMNAMKSALTSFTNALDGTPTQFSVTQFGTSASVVSNFTSDVASTNLAINSVSTGGGGTNWEAGLIAAGSTFDPRVDKPNLVIFASDGDPTYHNGGGNGSSTSQTDINAAVTQANIIKNGGTRMLALGIGGPTVSRLESISGPNVNTGDVLTSDVITTDFEELAESLAEFADQTCGGTITVNKVLDQDGNPNTAYDQAPGVDWSFDIDGNSSNPAPVPTDANGQTSAVSVTAGTYNVNEIVKAGYQLVAASCTGAGVNGSKNDNAVTGISVGANDIVTCTFINSPTPTLKLVKTVTNNNGGTKTANDFQAKIDGNNVPWSTAVSVGVGSHNASEINLPGYAASSWGGDCAPNGAVTLALGQNKTCTITNDDKPANLTVTKNVVNPYGTPAPTSSFSLYVGNNQVSSGVSNQFDAGAYVITEVGLSGYAFTGVSGDCAYQQSTIGILLGLDESASCTLTNIAIQPKLIVTKVVVNDNSGTKEADDFTMNVSGNSQNVPNFPGNENGTEIGLNEGSYSVDELYAAGYSKSLSGDCSGTISVGEVKYCTITNNDVSNPAINIEKYGPATALEGQNVNYVFHVTNTGDTPLNNVTVNDSLIAGVAYQFGDDGDNKLENGEVWVYTAQYQIPVDQEANVLNTVTACADEYAYYDDVKVSAVNEADVCDSDNHELDVLHPSLNVAKSGPSSAEAGEEVTYSFAVTNTGDVALTVTQVEDSIAGSGVYVSGDVNTNDLLDLGETWVYSSNYTIPTGQTQDVVNTVTVCSVIGRLQVEEDTLQSSALSDSLIAPQINLPPAPVKYCDNDSHTLKIEQPKVDETVLAPSGSDQNNLAVALATFNFLIAMLALALSQKSYQKQN